MSQKKRQSLKKTTVLVTLLVVLLGCAAYAQSRRRVMHDDEQKQQAAPKRKERGPRAVGVLDVLPNGRARLTPVTILVDGKWYDAGLYKADPRPMSLEPGTVYEGEKSGESKGLFTITAIQEPASENGRWLGFGRWKTSTFDEPSAPKEVQLGKKQDKAAPDDEDRPILHKPAANATSGSAAPAPAPGSQTTSTSGQPAPKPKARRVRDNDDPNRPVLRRGAPTEARADTPDDFMKPLATGLVVQTLAAVSDAGGPEPRSYTMMLRPAEREEYTQKLQQFATESLKKFAATGKAGKSAPTNFNFAGIQVNVFDVNTSNDAVLVFTARAAAAPAVVRSQTPQKTRSTRGADPTHGRAMRLQPQKAQTGTPEAGPNSVPSFAGYDYYVTLVARVDVNNEVRKLFESVTDTNHLDAYPRLQLVDCVDANGDGMGELLFRETYDRSNAFVLYRVGMDKLWPLFETAQTSLGIGQQ